MSCVRTEKIEALFIPEGWWHQVTSSRGTVAVNVWFKVMYIRREERYFVATEIYVIRHIFSSKCSTIRFAVVDTIRIVSRLVVVTPGCWGEGIHCRQTVVVLVCT